MRRLRQIALLATLGTTFILLLLLMWVSLLPAIYPRSLYFTYHSIEAVTAKVGQTLVFESTYDNTTKATFSYIDDLVCDYHDGEGFIQRYSRPDTNAPKIGAGRKGKWDYTGFVVPVPARCYLQSSVRMQINPFVAKAQTLESTVFEVKP